MKTKLLVTSFIAFVASSSASLAHDYHTHEESHSLVSARVWKNSAGKAIQAGSFIASNGTLLIIEDQNGEIVSINQNALGSEDRQFIEQRVAATRKLNTQPIRQTAAAGSTRIPANSSVYLGAMQRSFGAFSSKVKTRSDARSFYVESDSIPAHQMMVGITAWQQQVPIPQPYTGNNAWQIPLHPTKAARPMSAKNNFFRGAIALAANGVPIFNPIKNDGRTDTVVAGELDRWGGHCGRADDYHYHIAPTHLQGIVGKANPVAFALDGYPIYGYTEPDGSPVTGLDSLNGHKDKNGNYHYHATKTYPYLNGGFYGKVNEAGGQVDPQPRARGVRPYTRPLRGATITGFAGNLASGYSLKYSLNGRSHFVNYKVQSNGSVDFKFIDPSGRSTSQSYTPRQGGGGDRRPGGGREKGKGGPRPPRPDGDRPPRRRSDNQSDTAQPTQAVAQASQNTERRGPAPDGERKPWIATHLSELDTDKDGAVSRKEMLTEAAITFFGYDQNLDNKLSEQEYRGKSSVRSAMGGFVNQHHAEFDRNSDKIITPEEVDAFALRMFTKADQDKNNIVTSAEANTRGGGGKRGQANSRKN